MERNPNAAAALGKTLPPAAKPVRQTQEQKDYEKARAHVEDL